MCISDRKWKMVDQHSGRHSGYTQQELPTLRVKDETIQQIKNKLQHSTRYMKGQLMNNLQSPEQQCVKQFEFTLDIQLTSI